MKVGLFWRVLPVHIAIVGLLLIPVWQRQIAHAKALQAGQQAQTRLVAAHQTKPVLLEGEPARLLLPRLAIDLPVVQGVFNTSKQAWSVSPGSANYAPNTAKINNLHDSSLIYGHWTAQVLGPTKQLVPGDIAYVYTDNNHADGW